MTGYRVSESWRGCTLVVDYHACRWSAFPRQHHDHKYLWLPQLSFGDEPGTDRGDWHPIMSLDIRSSALKSPIDVAEYLFRRLHQVGVRGVHGVPGDYNLV